jgi:hypothetical protein
MQIIYAVLYYQIQWDTLHLQRRLISEQLQRDTACNPFFYPCHPADIKAFHVHLKCVVNPTLIPSGEHYFHVIRQRIPPSTPWRRGADDGTTRTTRPPGAHLLYRSTSTWWRPTSSRTWTVMTMVDDLAGEGSTCAAKDPTPQQMHHRQWVMPAQPHTRGGVGSLITGRLPDASDMHLPSGWRLRAGDADLRQITHEMIGNNYFLA